jgi:hypothetical protein
MRQLTSSAVVMFGMIAIGVGVVVVAGVLVRFRDRLPQVNFRLYYCLIIFCLEQRRKNPLPDARSVLLIPSLSTAKPTSWPAEPPQCRGTCRS